MTEQRRREDPPQLGRILIEAVKWVPLLVLAYNFVSERTEQRIAVSDLRKDMEQVQGVLDTKAFVDHAVWKAHKERDIEQNRKDIDHLLKIFSGVSRGND